MGVGLDYVWPSARVNASSVEEVLAGQQKSHAENRVA